MGDSAIRSLFHRKGSGPTAGDGNLPRNRVGTRQTIPAASCTAPSIEYPKIRIISGNTVPTRALALRDNSSKRELDFNSFPREMGDGETLVADTLPQTGIPYEVFYSDKSHIHLMDTPVILKLLTDGGGPH